MKKASAGFSLVEVVLALALVVFAMVAMLGLVPVGLKQNRESIEETRAAHLAQTVFTTLQGMNFASFQAFYDAPPFVLSSIQDFTGTPSRDNAQIELYAVFPSGGVPLLTADRGRAAKAGDIACTVGLWFQKMPDSTRTSGSAAVLTASRVMLAVYPQDKSADGIRFQAVVGDY